MCALVSVSCYWTGVLRVQAEQPCGAARLCGDGGLWSAVEHANHYAQGFQTQRSAREPHGFQCTRALTIGVAQAKITKPQSGVIGEE